jgi:hypothetical protein
MSLKYFLLLSHKSLISAKTYLTDNIYFEFLYHYCLKFFYFMKNSVRYYYKCTNFFIYNAIFVCDFNDKLIFSTYYDKSSQCTKIHPMEAK